MSKLLTIGMATYDDFDGVYFTIQSLRLHHERCNTDDVEYIVLDANPEGEHGKTVKDFITGGVGKLGKYIPYKKEISSSFHKYDVVKYATGKYVLILDCHILLKPKAIDYLLKYYELNPNCKDLIQGPMIYDDLKNYSTQFNPTWGGDMYGQWGTNTRACELGKPFDIPMMGLGVFSCETRNWLGFNDQFKGFGGEEGYIHEKFRQNGGRTICLPQFKWMHRFGRPGGVKYPLVLEDRIWNYFLGWLELKRDPEHPMIKEIYDNFKNRIPRQNLDQIFAKAKETILL